MAEFDASRLPASVRQAPALGQEAPTSQAPSLAGLPAQETAPAEAPAKEPSWRLDLADAQQFQQAVQLSSQGAVVFVLWAPHSPASVQMLEATEALVNSAGGNLLLAAVDITKLPEVGQAFQVQGVPAGIAVLAGRPAPLFNGPLEPAALTELLGQVLQLAAQQGLPGGFEPVLAPEDKPLPPLHQEAIAALDAGNYQGAQEAYQRALAENPGDQEAKIGLAQVQLLARVAELDTAAVRQQAAAAPEDVRAQLQVADLDIVGGHVEDAFKRLIDLFKRAATEDKNLIRQRLLDLFEVVGSADPRVTKARSALMMAIF